MLAADRALITEPLENCDARRVLGLGKGPLGSGWRRARAPAGPRCQPVLLCSAGGRAPRLPQAEGSPLTTLRPGNIHSLST